MSVCRCGVTPGEYGKAMESENTQVSIHVNPITKHMLTLMFAHVYKHVYSHVYTFYTHVYTYF